MSKVIDARMAEQSLQSLDVRSRADRQGSCCMAKIVRCEAIQANRPGCWVPDVATKVCVVEHSPAELVNTRSSGPFPWTCLSSSSTTNPGIGTVRRLWFFGVSSSRDRSGMASATSIRPRSRSGLGDPRRRQTPAGQFGNPANDLAVGNSIKAAYRPSEV